MEFKESIRASRTTASAGGSHSPRADILILATAFYGSERFEEAVAAAKTAIELDECRVDPYLILAASSVVLDHSEEARRAAQKVLKLKPEFNLAQYAESQPYKEQRDLDGLIDQLRSVGLEQAVCSQ